jgi:hypothetical protein
VVHQPPHGVTGRAHDSAATDAESSADGAMGSRRTDMMEEQ